MRNDRHIHFRASAPECEVLNAIADEEGTTASAILRRLIRTHLANRASEKSTLAPAASRTDGRERDAPKPS